MRCTGGHRKKSSPLPATVLSSMSFLQHGVEHWVAGPLHIFEDHISSGLAERAVSIQGPDVFGSLRNSFRVSTKRGCWQSLQRLSGNLASTCVSRSGWVVAQGVLFVAAWVMALCHFPSVAKVSLRWRSFVASSAAVCSCGASVLSMLEDGCASSHRVSHSPFHAQWVLSIVVLVGVGAFVFGADESADEEHWRPWCFPRVPRLCAFVNDG